MRWFPVTALLLARCAGPAPERLDRLYEAADVDVRAGEMARAEKAAERGVALAAARRDLWYQWRFRLLRADILLFSRRAGPVLADLSEPMPASPEFAELAARKRMFESRAVA